MQFGTFLLMQSPDGEPSQEMYARAVDVAQAAEDLGYHTLWLAEHHFSSYGYLSRPMMMAAHIAARTKRVRIGTAVIVAPLHNPLVLAEEVATADLLSQGRLDVGLGRGYQPYEFKRFGMTLDDNRERWEEAADILVKALTQESFSYQGKYHSFDDTAVLPRPVQKPHPPIWDAAQSLGSITAAVRRGFSIMTSGAGAPFETIVDFRRAFDEAVDQFKPEVTPTFAITEKIYVADDEEDALNTSKEALWNMRVSVGL